MEEIAYGFKASAIVDEGRITWNHVKLITDWLATENLHLTDEQIVLFSLSCLNNLEETKATIKSYYSTKRMCPTVFTKRRVHLDELQQQLKVTDYAVFPKRTADGCAIIFHRLRDFDFRQYHMQDAMKLLFMTLDAAIYDDPPTGLVILFDMKGVGLLHLTKVKLGLVKAFFQYLQESLPVRLSNVHVLNSVYFLEKVMSIIRPFMKVEVMDRIHFHSSTIDMAHFFEKCIPRECLPADYGGLLDPVEVLTKKTTRQLLELEMFFEAEERQQKRNICPTILEQ